MTASERIGELLRYRGAWDSETGDYFPSADDKVDVLIDYLEEQRAEIDALKAKVAELEKR